MLSGRTAPKVRALSSRPEVAATIDVGSTPAEAKALLVRGVATLETVDGVPDEYLAGSRKSLDAEQAEAFERQVESTYAQMVRISIEPRWARFYDFGAGRIPSFLSKLANRDRSKSNGRSNLTAHVRQTELGGRRPYRLHDERDSGSGRWEMGVDAGRARAVRAARRAAAPPSG